MRLTILFILFSTLTYGQITDTLRLPYKKALILVFDEQPTFENGWNGIVPDVKEGDNKLVLRYGYNEEIDFPETNLFVQSGKNFYMFIVVHDENPKRFLFNYQNGIKNVNSTTKTESNPVIEANEMTDVASLKKENIIKNKKDSVNNKFKNNCEFINLEKQDIFNKGVIGKGKCSLILTNLYAQDDYLYLKLSIKNKSKIDYLLSDFKFFLTPKSGKVKNRVVSDLEFYPVYFYPPLDDKKIIGKSTKDFIVVLNKFTLERDKKFMIKALEEDGERSLEFSLFAEDLYKAKNIYD